MKKTFMSIISVVCLAMIIAACGTQSPDSANPGDQNQGAGAATQELKVTHQLGETTVKLNPQKVIVFDFGALDTLDKLGIEVKGVAKSSLPPYLEKYNDKKYENIGSLKEPDFEKISAIKPDLILISGRQSDSYAELSKLGPTVFIGVDNNNYIESFKTNMQLIGQIFGKEAEVKAELDQVDKVISDVQQKAKANGQNALIILANEGAVSAYGPGSRFGIIHDVMGIPAVDTTLEVSTHGQSISFEYVMEKNPDYLFVIDRGAVVGDAVQSGAKALVENELVKKTKAYQNGHIVYLDPSYWYLSGGGLVSTVEMINEVAAAYK